LEAELNDEPKSWPFVWLGPACKNGAAIKETEQSGLGGLVC
jgi:hypothetical protein